MTSKLFTIIIAFHRNYNNEKITVDDIELYSYDGSVFNIKLFLTITNNETNDTYKETIHANRQVNEYELPILLEIMNKSPLWKLFFDPNLDIPDYSNYYSLHCEIQIINNLIDEYINKSIGLYLYIVNATTKKNRKEYFNAVPDIKNISYIPDVLPINQPNNFKVNLHTYQKRNLAKMLNIENPNYSFNISGSYTINVGEKKIVIDPLYCKIGSESIGFKATTKGGILADEMGLGKTITSISLIAKNPFVPSNDYLKNIDDNTKIISKATLIVTPSHLLKQWEDEIKKCCPHFRLLTIATKVDYKGLTFDDFINSDCIITSYQFLMNFSFYPSLYYKSCTANSYRFSEKNEYTQASLESFLGNYKTLDTLKKCEQPIFEFFYFHRLILDETHEIFGNVLSNVAQTNYLCNWVTSIDANYNWYVSGTPFINYGGLMNCVKYIKLKFENQDNKYINFAKSENINNTGTKRFENNLSSKLYDKLVGMNCVWETVLNNLCIRHRKCDVENEVDIMGYQEKIIWVKFTDTEKQLYDAKKNSISKMELQQLCCHPLILESARKIVGSLDEVDLDVIKSKMIDHHKQNLETYSKKITLLDKTRPEYNMVFANYNRIISESKFILTILEKIDEPSTMDEESCAICMDCLDKPTLTSCGHMFCYDCIKMCLNNVKKCPMCKQDLEGKELIKIISENKNTVEKDLNLSQDNLLIEKYGSKLGKLISIIRCITTRDDTRIIVFSQWDDMLRLVGKTLSDNGIGNTFIKGNVWSRTSAIKKFKDGDTHKVIMLSLKNAASGTNLTEATHIFFVEPIDAPRKESLAIETQAIARACRIGQKQQVMILRVLVENTIEHEVFTKYYDSNTIIANEEKDYFVNMAPPQIELNTNETQSDTNQKNTDTNEKKKVIRKKKTDNNDSVNVNNDLTTEKKKRVVRKKKTDNVDNKDNIDNTDKPVKKTSYKFKKTNVIQPDSNMASSSASLATSSTTSASSSLHTKTFVVYNSNSSSDSDSEDDYYISSKSQTKPVVDSSDSDSDELEL